MKKEMYFIFSTPPLTIYRQRYCIDYFKENNWNIHIIDLSPIINPIAYKSVQTGVIEGQMREIFFCKMNYYEYAKKIIDDAIFILTTDFNYNSYFIHRNIRKKQHYGYMNRMDTNMELDKSDTSKRISGLLRGLSIHRIINSIFIRLPRKILPIKAADFVILGGMENREEYIRLCYVDEHTVIKHIHSLDYEKYLEVRDDKQRIIDEPYCVFLDQFLPYHPDNISAGYNLSGTKYYEEMTRMFYKIENNCHIKVVIAAHPRSDYELHQGLFDNFRIIRFKTAELVRDAEFVLAHFSTSISYAVMFHKPVALLMSENMNEIEIFKLVVKKYSMMLSIPIIDVSNTKNMKELLHLNVNKSAYEEFKKLYLKADVNKSEKKFAKQLGELIDRLYTLR